MTIPDINTSWLPGILTFDHGPVSKTRRVLYVVASTFNVVGVACVDKIFLQQPSGTNLFDSEHKY